MRGRLVALVLVTPICFLSSSSARADPRPVGLEVTFGASVTAPGGALGTRVWDHDGSPMSHVFSAGLSFGMTAGLRVGPVFVGPAVEFALLPGCGADNSCTGPSTDLHVGGEVRGYVAPPEKWEPWVGGGGGYELATGSTGSTYSGWDFDLRAGADFRTTAASPASVGPFVSVRFGKYSANGSFEGGVHEWFTLGVRAVWDPR